MCNLQIGSLSTFHRENRECFALPNFPPAERAALRRELTVIVAKACLHQNSRFDLQCFCLMCHAMTNIGVTVQ